MVARDIKYGGRPDKPKPARQALTEVRGRFVTAVDVDDSGRQLPPDGVGTPAAAVLDLGDRERLTTLTLTGPLVLDTGQNDAVQLARTTNNDLRLTESGNFRVVNNDATVALLTITNAGVVNFSASVDAATSYKVAGTKVVGARGAGITAPAASVADCQRAINDIIARLVAHGLIS